MRVREIDMNTATPNAGVMTGGQPESSRVGVCGFSEGHERVEA